MGIFYERASVRPAVHEALRDALAAPTPPQADIDAEAARRAAGVTDDLERSSTLQVSRVLVALGLFCALIGAAIATEAADLGASSKALWGLTASVLGLIVGFSAGRSPRANRDRIAGTAPAGGSITLAGAAKLDSIASAAHRSKAGSSSI